MVSPAGTRATVGRGPERALLRRRVARATAGNGGAVLVSGEPGIGKTRLVLDAAEEARRQGHAVAVGTCRETGAVPAFWPWVQVLRRLVAEEDPAALHRRMGPAADDLLAVIGAGSGSPVRVPAGRALDSSHRMRLFEGVAGLLGEARPVVVVLEDLHRADDASLALLRHLAVESWPPHMLLVATYRHTEAPHDRGFPATLAALGAGCPCDELTLRPLDPADAATVADEAGGGLPAADLPVVVARAGGNPLFLQQLARAVSSGAPPSAVPGTLREVVRDRVARLSDGCRAPLEVLAVAGRQADARVVADVVGIGVAHLLTLVEPAVAAGLVLPVDGGRELHFAHALVQEALYEGVGHGRRAELHERLAGRLARLPLPDARLQADIAAHALRAARGGRPVDPVPALRAAAAAACRSLAFTDAARLLESALPECGDAAVRVPVLLESGDALASAGRPVDARRRFERAAEEARSRADPRALAAAALGTGTCVVPVGEADWSLVALLEDALQACPEEEPALRARLRARLAVELYWHDGDASRRHSAQALQDADASADLPATVEALHARLFTLRGPDPSAERLALGRRLVALAAEHRLEDAELRGWVFWLPELLRSADMAGHRAGVQRMRRLADRSRQPLHRWYADVFAAQLAMIGGRAGDAASHSDAAVRLAARLGIEAGEVYHLGQQVALRRDTGGLEALVDPLAAVADRFPALVTMRMLLVVVLAETGRAGEARPLLAALAGSDLAAVPRDSLWLATVCYAAEAARVLREPVVAEASRELLEPFRGSCAVQGLPVCWGAVDRAVGLARAARGDVDGAVADLRTALDLHERWGMPALAARTRLDLAEAHAVAGPPGRSRALALALQARDRARDLGLPRLALRAEEVAASLSPRRTAGEGPREELSPRERDVLRLIAEGVSNKGIAERLVISVNTVERHVRNLYVKLGVPNRAAATAYAVRAGLTAR